MIAEDWPQYATRPGRNETPLDELSFEAWIKQYKPSENFVNRAVSYYEKGLWTGMALDLELRLATGGTPRPARDVPLDLGALRPRRAARRRAGRCATPPRRWRAAGCDRFFERYVRGTDELPLPALWRRAGLKVAARAEWDESAKPPADRDRVRARRARAWTGIALHPERTLVRNVVPGFARLARRHHVRRRHRRGRRRAREPATFAKRVGDADPGARVRIAYFRRDLLSEATLTLGAEPGADLVRRTPTRAPARAPPPCAPAGSAGPARMIRATAAPRGRARPRGHPGRGARRLRGAGARNRVAGRGVAPTRAARRARPRARRPPARVHPRRLAAAHAHRSPTCRAPPRTTRSPHAPGAPWPVYLAADEDRDAVAAALARALPARASSPASTLRPLPPRPRRDPRARPALPAAPLRRARRPLQRDVRLGQLLHRARPAARRRAALARDMVDDFLYEVRHYGGVLNANRTYYLTRSQPPLLSAMVLARLPRDAAIARGWPARATRSIAAYEHWTGAAAPDPGARAVALLRSRRRARRPRWSPASATPQGRQPLRSRARLVPRPPRRRPARYYRPRHRRADAALLQGRSLDARVGVRSDRPLRPVRRRRHPLRARLPEHAALPDGAATSPRSTRRSGSEPTPPAGARAPTARQARIEAAALGRGRRALLRLRLRRATAATRTRSRRRSGRCGPGIASPAHARARARQPARCSSGRAGS